jgi:hypothetical protein
MEFKGIDFIIIGGAGGFGAMIGEACDKYVNGSITWGPYVGIMFCISITAHLLILSKKKS